MSLIISLSYNVVKHQFSISSLLGGQSVGSTQIKLIQPALKAGVKLFVPSELGMAWTEEEEDSVGALHGKKATRHALQQAGLPFVRIVCGGFADLFN